ncbi:MAG: DNA-processing protein DprA [Christensenellales bacterium]|jgi:DNA processing protein
MEYTAFDRSWIALAAVDGIGPATMGRILAVTRDPATALKDAEKLAAPCKLKPKLISAMRLHGTEAWQEGFFGQLELFHILAIPGYREEYPGRLTALEDAPMVLFVRGNREALETPKALAMVGSRHPSRYGRETALRLAGELADQGVTVVSGLARGVDAYSHIGCLNHGGTTVAVLGCGPDICYPAENREVFSQILETGVVVSEYAPGVPPDARHFPPRNRIISGLSDGLLVVEAGKRSGTQSTLNFAIAQDKALFALPGAIDNELSYLPNQMIRDGAHLTTSAEDVTMVMGWDLLRPGDIRPYARGYAPPEQQTRMELEPMAEEKVLLEEGQREIYNLIRQGTRSLNRISEETGFPIYKVQSDVMMMQLQGLVRMLSRNEACIPGKEQ